MPSNSSPADRLRRAMLQNLVRTGAELARRSGQNDVTVRSHLNGTRAISRKSAEAYCRALHIEPSWLLFGVGEAGEAMTRAAESHGQQADGATGQPMTSHRGRRPDDESDAGESIAGNLRGAGIAAPDFRSLGRDVPVLGTAECGKNGAFTLNSGDPIDFVRRPPGVANRKGIYCIYTEGSSMEPAYEAGDLVYADPHRPPRPGRDVVIQLRARSAGGEARCLLKRLVRRAGDKWVLRQFNPATDMTIHDRDVLAVHLVLKNHELLGV